MKKTTYFFSKNQFNTISLIIKENNNIFEGYELDFVGENKKYKNIISDVILENVNNAIRNISIVRPLKIFNVVNKILIFKYDYKLLEIM